MRLKDLDKIRYIETSLMLGIPIGFVVFNGASNPDLFHNMANFTEFQESLVNTNNGYDLIFTLAAIPRLADLMFSARIEPNTDDYKNMKVLYDKIIKNLAQFLKEQNITDPVEMFAVYQYMYRNGYLSFNHNFNYDIDMKDLSRLNGADMIRGTGVCRTIASFFTDLSKEMGYDSFNLSVNCNRILLKNIDRQGNYPKWNISKNTNKFVKVVSKFTGITRMPNHLITCIEKNDSIYIFDPTNDAFLVKGNSNNLILPDKKEGKMKISYITNTIDKISGKIGNLKTGVGIQSKITKPTIDYDEYKTIYKNTLIFIKSNLELFDDFYRNNQSLYEDLFERLNNQESLIRRVVPELKIKNVFNRLKSSYEDNKSK